VSTALDGPFMVATAELGVGGPLRHFGIYRHRIGGGMMVSYLEYLEQDERQLVVGFSVQSLGALIAPLFIQP